MKKKILKNFLCLGLIVIMAVTPAYASEIPQTEAVIAESVIL